jgi:hypothetical protein
VSNKIILKKSSVADKAPTTGDLEYGELAINYADKRLYFRDSTNSISYFSANTVGSNGSYGTANTIQIGAGDGSFISYNKFSYNNSSNTLIFGSGGSNSNNDIWDGTTHNIIASNAIDAKDGDSLQLSGGDGGIFETFIGFGGNLVLRGGTSYTSAKSGSIIIKTNDTDRVIIDPEGNFIQGSNTAVSKHTVYGTQSSRTILAKTDASEANNIPFTAWNNATSGNNVFMEFGTETGYTARGNITYNRDGGLVSYNTTSDYRSKVIIGPVTDSGDTIDALKVYNGIMIDANIMRPMLIAHEVQEITPYAVTGEKDAVDKYGNPLLQQMDHSSLIPLLIAEIQSLRVRVKQLEDGKK